MRKILLAVLLLFSQSAAQAECVYLSIPDECQAEAEKGNAIAQFILGFMYENGEGVSQDYKKAEKWYHKAAEQGDTDAQYNLGNFYNNDNLGVAHDYVMSHMWFNIAGVNGYQDAFTRRDSVAEKMTPSQIQEAQIHASEWMAKYQ